MTAAQRLALPAAWLGLIVLVGVIEPDAFLTSANAQNILGSQAVLVVLTMGLLIALTAGDYDLSIASVLTLSSMIVALLNAQQGWPVGLAIVVAVVARALAGLTTGGVPRRHQHLARTLQSMGLDRRGVFRRHGSHGPSAVKRHELRAAALLRGRADLGSGSVTAGGHRDARRGRDVT